MFGLKTLFPPAWRLPSRSLHRESVTFTADVPDASDDNPVTHVPWQIFFNGDLLSDSELATYVILDAAVGTTLDAWSDSTYLTFTPIEQGCYTVGVLNFIELTTTNQEILPATVKVSGAPSQPVLSGFDQLACVGGSSAGNISAFTVGEAAMTLNYNLTGPAGFDPVTGNGSPWVKRATSQVSIWSFCRARWT